MCRDHNAPSLRGLAPRYRFRGPPVRCRTDGRGAQLHHYKMEPSRTPLTAIYIEWLNAWRSIFTRTPPAQDSTPPPAQAAAEQEWEHEGGSIKQPKKPGREPEPKIPL